MRQFDYTKPSISLLTGKEIEREPGDNGRRIPGKSPKAEAFKDHRTNDEVALEATRDVIAELNHSIDYWKRPIGRDRRYAHQKRQALLHARDELIKRSEFFQEKIERRRVDIGVESGIG